MGSSLRDATADRQGVTEAKSSYPVGGNPAKPPTQLERAQIRQQAADACRRASWQAVKMIASELGSGYSEGAIYKMTSGENRSPIEVIDTWTARAIREGVPQEDALAMVAWLARRWLSPDELRDLAAMKEAEADAAANALRNLRAGVMAAQGEIADGSRFDTVAVRRELRRARQALDDLEDELDRAVASGPFGGDGAAEKVEARG